MSAWCFILLIKQKVSTASDSTETFISARSLFEYNSKKRGEIADTWPDHTPPSTLNKGCVDDE
jgi:hypothetical protein